MIPFPIVDTHVHLWDPSHIHYAWLDGVEVLNRSFLPKDFREHCGPVEVERIVFLECDCGTDQAQAEADWVTSLAQEDPRIQGLVLHAPLELGDGARDELDVLSENGLVKGIRRLIQSESMDFCLDPDFVRGVQLLPDYGFSFDLCIVYPQLKNTIQLVQQCPNVQFILDHIGKPDIKNHIMEPWKTEIEELAGLPNVWCKVSGLVTEADMDHWEPAHLRPYIDHVVASFGFDRVIFGGDWPVVYQACEYPDWVETLEEAVSGCSEAELRKLFYDNAMAFYRLE
ncbi:MAG: amidohydrolase family protein [bacterium]|nr:amidohydrolase family protein [bacterium]